MKARVTLEDVGRLVGVSGVTVSNVINRRGGTSAATQAKVWAAVEATGYVADPAARRLAGGKTHTVGVLVPNLSTQYASETIRGVSEALGAAGMGLLVSTTPSVSSERRQASFLAKLTDGLIFLLPHEGQGDQQDEQQDDLRTFDLHGGPLVAIEYRGAGRTGGSAAFPTVNIDDDGGTRQAVRYLAALGHRRVGFIGGPPGRSAAEVRLRAYRETLTASGLEADPQLVAAGDFTQPAGFRAAHLLLARSDPPTALFAANDVSAFGAIEAVKDLGLRVPEDVSVVGFDDVPMASQVFPALTTVRRPLEQMGRVAVALLVAQLRGETVEADTVLPTALVVRSSSGPLAGR